MNMTKTGEETKKKNCGPQSAESRKENGPQLNDEKKGTIKMYEARIKATNNKESTDIFHILSLFVVGVIFRTPINRVHNIHMCCCFQV